MRMKMMKISHQLFLVGVLEEKNLRFQKDQKQNQELQQQKVDYQNNYKEVKSIVLLKFVIYYIGKDLN